MHEREIEEKEKDKARGDKALKPKNFYNSLSFKTKWNRAAKKLNEMKTEIRNTKYENRNTREIWQNCILCTQHDFNLICFHFLFALSCTKCVCVSYDIMWREFASSDATETWTNNKKKTAIKTKKKNRRIRCRTDD